MSLQGTKADKSTWNLTNGRVTYLHIKPYPIAGGLGMDSNSKDQSKDVGAHRLKPSDFVRRQGVRTPETGRPPSVPRTYISLNEWIGIGNV